MCQEIPHNLRFIHVCFLEAKHTFRLRTANQLPFDIVFLQELEKELQEREADLVGHDEL